MRRSLGIIRWISAEMVQSPYRRDSSATKSLRRFVSSGWAECKSGANIKALALLPGSPSMKQAFRLDERIGNCSNTTELSFSALLFDLHVGIVTPEFNPRSALTAIS